MLDEAGNQQPWERPDIVVRVFMIKLRELMTDIKKRQHFGKTKASKCAGTSFISSRSL